MLLRELRITETLFEPQLTGPDRSVSTEKLKKKLTQHGPPGCHGSFSGFAEPFGVGQNLYEVGKALADLSDLDQHVKSVHKVRAT